MNNRNPLQKTYASLANYGTFKTDITYKKQNVRNKTLCE